MHPRLFTLGSLTCLLAAGTAIAGDIAAAHTCTSFDLKNVSEATVTGRTFYKAGDNVTLGNLDEAVSTTSLPSFCRIQLVITTNTTANSSAQTEVWLPVNWNQRFVTFGNGGLGGGASYQDLAYIAAKQGYAGMSTDTGHQSAYADGTWAGPEHENAIVDFAWRATHLSVVIAKEVVKQYYGKAHKKSYYHGCSTGGRQGFKEVQSFPEDFDGVVIGSPANWLSHLLASMAHSIILTQPVTSSRFISQDTWTNVIHPEVLRQCDGLDGLEDGLINDPRRCMFEPETLTCGPNQNVSTCLTLDQIAVLHKLYTNYYDTNQTFIFGGFYPGSELGMSQYIFNEEPIPFVTQGYRYLVANDTAWDYDQFNFSSIVQAEDVLSAQLDAASPNLTSFVATPRSGKILHYVGWGENLISAGGSIHYYESVRSWMKANGNMDVDNFYRLFMVPGMEHCMGGFGPNAFGGTTQAAVGMPPLKEDSDHDILAAMVKWVEDDVPPTTIIGTAYNNNDAADGVAFTRPLCKYPASAVYVSGDPTQASSFKCA